MNHALRRLLSLSLLGLCAVSSAHALYKVVGPDGKVTYTDRPPATAGNTAPVGIASDAPASAPSALPLELRQPATRYPVTLYVVPKDCNACDSGRTLLRERGIPFNERQIVSGEDVEALKRLTGAAEAPVLTVGSQVLRGLSADLWNQYLDAAGYPRESRLPASYAFPRATPLTERRDAARQTGPATPAAATPPAPTPTPSGAGGIRF